MPRPRFLAAPLIAFALLAACGDDDDAADTTTTTVDEAEDTTSTAGDDTEAATVSIAESDEYGEYLVDDAGRSLYLFTNDEGTTTACTGGCVENWPPYVADGSPTAGDGVDASLLGTAEGIRPDQVTYNGHLLYYFAGDITAGDTNGAEIPAWHLVDPEGNAIGAE